MSLARRPRPRRTWPQRAMLAVNVLVLVAAVGAAVALAYAKETVSSIPRTAFGNTLAPEEEERILIEGEEVEREPALNFLLVGIDSIRNLPSDHPLRNTRSEGNTLTDTLIVLRVDPATGDAAAMSIPRDLWVPIADPVGYDEKINAALALGGQQGRETLVKTISDFLDIPIHRYVEVDFNGFLGLVDEIGGVSVQIDYPMRDPKAQFEVNQVGCVSLTPEQALGYVRSRTLQALIDGQWRLVDSRSDLGRIERQQDFLVVALSQAFSRGLTDPTVLKGLVDNVLAAGFVTLDERTTPSDLLDLSSSFSDFDAKELRRLKLPVVIGSAGTRSVVRLVEAEAQDVLEVFRGQQDDTRSFRVVVLNGTGETGLAQEVEFALRAKNFRLAGAENADSFTYERTVIRYDTSQLDAALELQRWLAAGAVLEERSGTVSQPLDLVAGADWAGVLNSPREIGAAPEPTPDPQATREEVVITNDVTPTPAPTATPTPTPATPVVATIRGC